MGAFNIRSYNNDAKIEKNQVVNNIISNNKWYAFGHRDDCSGCSVYDNIYRGNYLFSIDPQKAVIRQAKLLTTSEAASMYPAEYFANIEDDSIDPVIITNDDTNVIKSNPDCVEDAGEWLARIVSADGSGTSFVVDNPYFFTDGYGINGRSGDSIQLEGSSSRVKVTNINHSTATITVNNTVSWTKGLGISLPYNDSKPDTGAAEVLLPPILRIANSGN
jgi:hypothetical protein